MGNLVDFIRNKAERIFMDLWRRDGEGYLTTAHRREQVAKVEANLHAASS